MRNLTPSLITSYSLRGILGPRRVGGDDHELAPFRQASQRGINVGVDLYLMMETDVALWCDHWAIGHLPAVDFMAKITNDQLEELCGEVLARLVVENAHPVAVTSFITEISNEMPGQPGVAFIESPWGKAICTLIRMADKFQAGRPQSVVQIVVGSVIDQFQVNGPDDNPRFTVSARKPEALIELVLDRLSHCLNYLQQEHGLQTDRLRIALELEPGPLYLLRGKESLEKFALAIEKHTSPLVKQCVGFNLDVAHWWLCRDICSEQDVSSSVRNRIFGAHISGHSPRGHFGDWGLWKLARRAETDPVSRRQLDAYLHWLRFLKDESKTPQASDHVSLELEAARIDEDILASIATLSQWLESP